jgi:hypothetical protein
MSGPNFFAQFQREKMHLAGTFFFDSVAHPNGMDSSLCK